MKNLYTLFVFVLLTVMTNLEVQAQQQVDTRGTQTGAVQSPRDSIWRIKAPEIKGSSFLFADWNTKGILYSKEGFIEVDSLNYNIYTNQIVTKKKKDSVWVYDRGLIDSVKIDGKRLHKLNNNFYEALQTGPKASLYKKYKTRIVYGEYSYAKWQQNNMVIKYDYWVLTEKKFKKIKPSKRNLENIFGDQASDMEKIIKAGDFDYKKEDDLILIFESFNS